MRVLSILGRDRCVSVFSPDRRNRLGPRLISRGRNRCCFASVRFTEFYYMPETFTPPCKSFAWKLARVELSATKREEKKEQERRTYTPVALFSKPGRTFPLTRTYVYIYIYIRTCAFSNIFNIFLFEFRRRKRKGKDSQSLLHIKKKKEGERKRGRKRRKEQRDWNLHPG